MHIGISRVPPNITGELTMAMTCLVVSHYTPGGGHKRLKPASFYTTICSLYLSDVGGQWIFSDCLVRHFNQK